MYMTNLDYNTSFESYAATDMKTSAITYENKKKNKIGSYKPL